MSRCFEITFQTSEDVWEWWMMEEKGHWEKYRWPRCVCVCVRVASKQCYMIHDTLYMIRPITNKK